MKERTATELAHALREAYRPDGAATLELHPGDKKAIAGLQLLAMWLKESAKEREAFNEWRRWRRENGHD
jgi:hypothetical protein